MHLWEGGRGGEGEESGRRVGEESGRGEWGRRVGEESGGRRDVRSISSKTSNNEPILLVEHVVYPVSDIVFITAA